MTIFWNGSNSADFKAAFKTLIFWSVGYWESWNLNGGDGNDTLIGGGANDTLDGDSGIDVLEGGDGNDFYIVDNIADQVIELNGQGMDFVRSSVSFTLPANVEKLELTGTAYQGIGNSSDNFIIGNGFENLIIGGNGIDILEGKGGNDTIYTYDFGNITGDDPSSSHSGIEYVFAGSGHDYLVAGRGMDFLYGDRDRGEYTTSIEVGSGNDTLVGAIREENVSDNITFMIGGKGNDLYIVRGMNTVYEKLGEGTDTVQYHDYYFGSIHQNSYTLDDNLENLELMGNALNGTGNNLDNTIKGNALTNTLIGQEGSDQLFGNAGNDTLYGGEGIDNLNGGDHDDVLYGGGRGDILVGEAGNDKLSGYGWTFDEIDTLIGNANADKFAIGTSTDAHYVGNGNSYAVIWDFVRGVDSIEAYGMGRNLYSVGTGNWAGDASSLDTGIFYNGDLVGVVRDNSTITTADIAFV